MLQGRCDCLRSRLHGFELLLDPEARSLEISVVRRDGSSIGALILAQTKISYGAENPNLDELISALPQGIVRLENCLISQMGSIVSRGLEIRNRAWGVQRLPCRLIKEGD